MTLDPVPPISPPRVEPTSAPPSERVAAHARVIGALHLTVRGLPRLLRAAGFGAVLTLTLLFARTRVQAWARPITDRMWNAKVAEQVLWGRLTGPDEKDGVSQFLVFFLLTVAVLATAVAWAVVTRVIARKVPRGRIVEAALEVAVVAAALVAARDTSPFLGHAEVVVLLTSALGLAAYAAPGTALDRASPAPMQAAIALVAEGIALAWAAWITLSPEQGPTTILVVLAAVALGAWRAGRAAAYGRALAGDGEREGILDALAGAPLLALPLVGLLREPSWRWPAAGLVLAAALRFALARLADRGVRVRLPALLASTFAPLSVATILFLPLRYRDLPTVSHLAHEAQHLAWLESATFGKVLFADAGLIYGPLREYGLGLIALLLGGLTLDHVRVAHLAFNVAGLAVLLAVGWTVARRSVPLQLLWVYLLLTQTPLFFFLDYWSNISFGWADLGRPALGALAVVSGLRTFERAGEGDARRAWRPLVGWGVVTAIALLYSQDCGMAAFAANVVAMAFDGAMRSHGRGWRARLRSLGVRLGAYVGGFVATIALVTLAYVAAGRWHALRLTMKLMANVSSGVVGAAPYPLSPDDFLTSGALFAHLGSVYGWRMLYVLPPLILFAGGVALAATLAWRRWSPRSTMMFGLFLFGCALYRYALARADHWHLTAGAIPAWLLLIGLLADATTFRLRASAFGRRVALPLASLLFFAFTAVGIASLDPADGLTARIRRIASGEEMPSHGKPYHYDDLPRAGDENVPADTLGVVRYIRANTGPRDPILVLTHFLSGGELYFLSERRNPTRFDLWSEVATHDDCLEVLAEIQRDPPKLIIGHGWRDYGPEVVAWVEQHYEELPPVQGLQVRKLKPSS